MTCAVGTKAENQRAALKGRLFDYETAYAIQSLKFPFPSPYSTFTTVPRALRCSVQELPIE